ncbi:ZP domain-containing protein-like [Branchiostoma floridae x Branchiostoma japonicum]
MKYKLNKRRIFCVRPRPLQQLHRHHGRVHWESTGTRLVGGEFYGCVELYDDVRQQWRPVLGWDIRSKWGTHYEDRMSWADLACKNLGFREGLATAGYRLANGVVSVTTPYSLQDRYNPYYSDSVPRFMLSQSLPQGEWATLHDAIDRADSVYCSSWYGLYTCSYHSDFMCVACAGERKQGISVHVTCTSNHIEASFPRPSDNSVQAADVQLAAPPCRAEGNSTHIYIRAPLGECGTSSETTPSEMIYRNILTIGADPSHGGITWDRIPKILLECRLPRNKNLTFDFHPHLMSVFRSDVQGQGDFEIFLELFRTDRFWYPVTEYPVFVELRQMIHVQIQVNSSDADLQVFAHTCVATPSDDPDDKTQNDVIIDGCPKLPTLQFYPSPGPDRGRFGFQAFAYTSGAPTVYLHCKVLLCKASDPNSRCAQGCQSPSGRRRREAEGEPEVYRLIQGPIVLGEDQRSEDQTGFQARVSVRTSSRQDLVTASSILGACAVLAAAMFVVGLLYKARREGRQAGYRALENVE